MQENVVSRVEQAVQYLQIRKGGKFDIRASKDPAMPLTLRLLTRVQTFTLKTKWCSCNPLTAFACFIVRPGLKVALIEPIV